MKKAKAKKTRSADIRISIRLTPHLDRRLKELAAVADRKTSEYARKVLLQHVQAVGTEAAAGR